MEADSLLEARLWDSLFKEAQNALKTGLLPKAVEDFRSAIKVSQNFPEGDERTLRSITGLGLAYSMQKDFSAASPFFEQALRLTQQSKGKEHPQCLSLLKQLGVANLAMRNYQRAAEYYDRAIAIYAKIQPDHPDVAGLKAQRNDALQMLDKQKRGVAADPEDEYERDARNMQVLSGRKSLLPKPTESGARKNVENVAPKSKEQEKLDLAAERRLAEDDLEGTSARLKQNLIDNKYQVIAAVGEGGMGTIFAGRHVALERDVAIKVVHKKAIFDGSDRERFRQEAKLLSKLTHPNIVSVHDFGETDNFYYLVMDFVDGQSLSARIAERGRISSRETLNMLIQLTEGLAHAHSKGILHRDLKPSNVMLVSQPGQADLVKLVDFGIAKSLNQSEEALQLTQDGETIGSPLYMSPEQCRGEPLDERSDIYSLGCLAFKALTGFTPFTGKNHFEIYIKHNQDAVPRLSEFTPGVTVPVELEQVITRCLRKLPDQRFTSMIELKAALQVVDI